MVSSGDRAHSQIASLDLAMDEVQSGRMIMGDHHLVITVFADNLIDPALIILNER
jgi:type IV secretion system protein VirB4